MIALTPELLHERLAAACARAALVAGPPEELLFEIVICDGDCGRVHNLIVHGPPRGWMTEGDLSDGFVDLCADCYRERVSA